jgi:hypothetical protein
MDRTADRLDIIELLHRYSWAMLDKDWVAWQACFADGAHVDYTTAGGIAGTPVEAAAWLEPTMSMFAITASQASNAVVTFDGDDVDEAKVRSMYRMVMKIDGGDGAPTYMEAQGAYADTVVRTADGWKIADRYEHLLYVR